jgi:outer membrane lipoprotein-sorting protein
MKPKILVFTLLLGLLVRPAFSQEQAKKLTVDEIVRKANHMAFYQGLDAKGRVSLVITDKQGCTRKRVFNMLRKDDGEKDRDQKFFAFFQAPADVRKMVFMVHKHAALEKDDDRWLYMPSLDLVKRIAAGDKRTSFVGSDFLYEDISGRSPAEDTHELIRTTDKHYVIKNIPKRPDSVEFEYYNAVIDKKTFIPLRMEYFKKGNRLYRIIESKELKQIQAMENGNKVVYPTVTRSVAKDLENKSQTRMTRSDIRFNIGLSDTVFTERYLRRPPRDAMR